jgi:hypothetical protein
MESTEARIVIASIRQLLNAIERQVVEVGAISQDIEVLASLEANAGKASDWVLRRRAEIPPFVEALFDRRSLGRDSWQLAGQKTATAIRGITID